MLSGFRSGFRLGRTGCATARRVFPAEDEVHARILFGLGLLTIALGVALKHDAWLVVGVVGIARCLFQPARANPARRGIPYAAGRGTFAIRPSRFRFPRFVRISTSGANCWS